MSAFARRIMGLGVLVLLAASPRAMAQVNFAPLERGDMNEVEDKVLVVQGLKAGGDYAFTLHQLADKNLPADQSQQRPTRAFQDFRLKLDSAIHRSVDLHLTLETTTGTLKADEFRRGPATDRNGLASDQSMSLQAREAYLRYRFNPRSGLVMGKHEVSLADRRGKTMNAIINGITFDCQVKTWCMPFGAMKLGRSTEDYSYHWALRYNGWEEETDGVKNLFQVEIFRLIYNEHNIPLTKSLAPGRLSNDPANTPAPDQFHTNGHPVYYDVEGQNYYGLVTNFQSGGFFLYWDVVAEQGNRRYHYYRNLDGSYATANGISQYHIQGVASEMEMGYVSPHLKIGFRGLHATGDSPKPQNSTEAWARNLNGFYEITPGTYKGARYYFNGADALVTDGYGLGHSINNTRMVGLFLDYDDPIDAKKAFSTGFYYLQRVKGVPDINGNLQNKIGMEWDNLFTVYWEEALKFQMEVNLFDEGPAFARDDVTVPDKRGHNIILQSMARVVYSF